MRKLVESTFMSLDGVISDPQVWGPPYWDEEHTAYNNKIIEPADALLLGRVTYDVFAQSWPARAGDPFADRMNAMPKYVASRTLDTLEWANSSLLEGDVPDAVRRLKAEDGDPLLVIGSSELVQTLIQHDLVDTFTVWTFPVVLGGGKRLFGEGTIPAGLELTDIQTATTGVTVATYERAGDIRYGSFAPDE